MTRPRPTDWIVMAALVIAWGSAFAGLRIAVAHIHPLWNTVIRIWVAVATLAVVLTLQRQAPPGPRDPAWKVYAITGFIGMSAPFALFAFAAARVPSAVNAMCNGASPIFTAVLAHLFVAGDRLTWRRSAGIGLGFGGLLVLMAPGLAHGGGEAAGIAMAVAGAAMYAFANVLVKRSPAVTPTVGALMMCLWAGVFALGTAAVLAPPPTMPPPGALAAAVALGVFPTALGSIGYVYLIQRRGPLFMSMSIYVAPLWATLLGVAFLDERPGLNAFAALGLILGGVALATLEPGERRRSPA